MLNDNLIDISNMILNIASYNKLLHAIKITLHKIITTSRMVMRQFGPNTKFGPETDSDQKQIRPKILITSN